MKFGPRTCSLAVTAILLAGGSLPAALGAAAARPNLLIIQTDEHNFRTLGAYRALLSKDQAFIWGDGIKVDTPNIDWLARQGAIADRYYATSPVCTPSRASLVSGRYPQNTGAIQNDLPLRDDIITFAEVLRRQGYATGYAGKWHLDGPGKPQFGPERKFGFEDNRYMFNRGHWKNLTEDARGPRVGTTDARGNPNYDLGNADAKTFATDFLTDRTIDFIRRHREQPFCYMVSLPDPHGPNTVRAPYDTMFLELNFQQPKSAQSPGRQLPAYAATLAGAFNRVQMARYFGMVKCIDDNVGRILATLREQGLLERTVIVFTSDHGDLCGEHGRDNKGVPMEGSARIPFILHAPGLVPPGTVVREALGTVDFKPTILSLLGVPNAGVTEGRDASALFRTGRAPGGWKDLAFIRIGGGPRGAAVSEDGEGGGGAGWLGAFSRRYKFVVAPNSAPSLFDLEEDPNELNNLLTSAAHRDTIRQLARELTAYGERHRDPHLAAARVQSDLAWAVSDAPAYPRTLSEPPAATKNSKRKGKQTTPKS
ncbi:MAG: sulfatase-like hydrolase/transferase [Opitutaceae bacterium]